MIDPVRTIEVFCDGSCYNRPPFNSMGIGFILKDSGEDNTVSWQYGPPFTVGYSVDLCTKGTNNIAEYAAIIEALSYLYINYKPVKDFGIDRIIIHSDSNMVVGQLTKDHNVNAEHLKQYHALATLLMGAVGKFAELTVKWVPRTHQYLKVADRAARYANPYFRSTKSPGKEVFNLKIHNYNEEIKR